MSILKLYRPNVLCKFLSANNLHKSSFKPLPQVFPLVNFIHTSTAHRKEPNDGSKLWADSKASQKVAEEIYYGPLSPRIRSVKLFSVMTSILGICAQPVIFQRAVELEASSSAIVATCGFVGFFTFVTPVLLHLVTKKYVTTVTYNKAADSYTASIFTLFLTKKDITFKPGEAEIPDVGGGFTSLKVRGIPLFLDSNFFTDVYHYKRIMGYDKPMDFKLTHKKDLT